MSEGNSKVPTLEAATAGASGGTLLALVAQNLSASPLKTWLAVLAPSLTVAITFVWSWVRVWMREKQAKAAIQEMRSRILEGLKRPHITESRRQHLLMRLDQLDDFEIESIALLITPNASSESSPHFPLQDKPPVA